MLSKPSAWESTVCKEGYIRRSLESNVDRNSSGILGRIRAIRSSLVSLIRSILLIRYMRIRLNDK